MESSQIIITFGEYAELKRKAKHLDQILRVAKKSDWIQIVPCGHAGCREILVNDDDATDYRNGALNPIYQCDFDQPGCLCRFRCKEHVDNSLVNLAHYDRQQIDRACQNCWKRLQTEKMGWNPV